MFCLPRVIGWLCCGLLILLLVAPVQAVTRPQVAGHTLTRWGMEDGLPHNLIHSIAQDRDGFVWLATWEGAARFNGLHFTSYTRECAPGVEALPSVLGIYALADGSVLAASNEGLFRYSRGKWQVFAEGAVPRESINGVFQAQDGRLLVTIFNKLYLLDAQGQALGSLAIATLPDTQILALAEEHDGAFLVGTEAGLFRLFDGRFTPLVRDTPMGTVAIRSIASDRQGGWYFGTDSGLWQLNRYGEMQSIRSDRRIDRVVVDPSGNLWLNVAGVQLVLRDPLGEEQTIPIPGLLTPALMVDADGLVWVGSANGLFQVSRGIAEPAAVDDDYARVVMQSATGALWMGSVDGLWRQQGGKSVRVSQRNDDGHEASVVSLAHSRQRGALWVGTFDRGIYRFDDAGHRVQHIDTQLPGGSSLIRSLLEDRTGTLWVGMGRHGLHRYRDGVLEPVDFGRDARRSAIHVLYEDRDGSIWFGSTIGMGHIGTDGTIRVWWANETVPARSIFDFHRDRDGHLWIASDRGLLRFRDGDFDVFNHRKGLPKDKVFRVIEDGYGDFWLSSNYGVFQVKRKEIAAMDAGERDQLSVVVVDQSDGLPAAQINGGTWPSGWLATDGRLYFPTVAGLGVIDPDRLARGQAAAVPLMLESVAIDGAHVDWQSGLLVEGDGRRLSLRYAGLNFRSPERVRYRYRMHGFDQDWVYAGGSTEAVYTNLEAGDYVFELQAMAMPLDWSNAAAIGTMQIPIEVSPPFWKHWKVINATIFLSVSVLIVFWWWRSSRYVRRQRVLNAIIEERTRELTEKNCQLELNAAERNELLARLSHQASHDALTGLPNRRAADSHLHDALLLAEQKQQSVCVGLLDVDHFKSINDGYGHSVGDGVLRRIGDCLSRIAGPQIFCSRHGGEEFLVVLVGMEVEHALQVLESLRRDIANDAWVLDERTTLHYTASIGVAFYGPSLRTSRQLLVAADRYLYQAKRQGRNRVLGGAARPDQRVEALID